MGAMMTENCSGCGFEFGSGELFEHERECVMVIRNRLEEAESTLAARDAEIERLKAMVETIERDLSEANGDVFIACAKVRSEIEIREKRERQLVWALRACGDDEALKFYGLDIIAMSDDDAGLLAAIDEATETKEKK